MNKKHLFAVMSLAALAACTSDDFESQQKVAQEQDSPVFEVINNSEALTRASMDGNKVVWSATDGDLFTLYHGATVGATSGYQNATYKASTGEGTAVLSTPSMILAGGAVMVWPVDTAFTIGSSDNLSLSIPETLENVENNIPYVSDQIEIITRATPPTGKFNEAGYNRTYPVYMRPMASQLNVKADYAGTDAIIAELYEGGSAQPADGGIDPISVTSVDLKSSAPAFTTKIPVKFTDPSTTVDAQWDAAVADNAWVKVTELDNTGTLTEVAQLTSKVADNEGCKFLILPRKSSSTGEITNGAVVVNTIYGKVVVGATAAGSSYSSTESADAWFRYIGASSAALTGETKAATPETSGDNAGKFKTTAAVATGMGLTIDGFTAYKAPSGIVKDEPIGAAATRYVKVLLNYLDMDGLHIKTDKQLRDAALVWKHLAGEDPIAVTVLLDGNDDDEFAISQNTIKTINEINAEYAETTTPIRFKVAPCTVTDEECATIVITGGGDIQDIPFIVKNSSTTADVALNEGEAWKWNGTDTDATATAETKHVKVGDGVKSIINRGTMTNAETATLAIYDATAATQITTVSFENATTGVWNITGGDLTVQFDVTNKGTVNISKGAEYHQDIVGTTSTTFVNEAETLPARFVLNDPSVSADDKAAFEEKIGLVNNNGVFAVTGTSTVKGVINNYGLIEHADKDAKTYITANMFTGSTFATPFSATSGSEKKIGRINLPFSNKDEDNLSINASAATGFVSVTVSTAGNSAPANGKLDLSTVGTYVNYCIVESGVTEISKVATAIKYLEFNDAAKTEIAWNLGGTVASPKTASYDGLIVLSPVNIKLGTEITVSSATYLGAKMYVGGKFTNGTAKYNGYYGNTTANEASMYITYSN